MALSLDSVKVCYRYSRYGVFPNLVGDTNIKDVSFFYISGYSSLCYQQAISFLCYLYLPRCDPVYKQIIHPCREMCHDYLDACSHLHGNKFDCDYLPPLNGNIPCFHQFVWCSEPPIVKYAEFVRRNDTVHYSCSEGLTLEGNKNITCMSTGRWSRPPRCLLMKPKETTSSFIEPLLSVFVLVILIVIIMMRCKIKLKARRKQGVNRVEMQVDVNLKEMDELLKDFRRQEFPGASGAQLRRNREFDSFVLYHLDTDDCFVISHLLPELEENRGFKLFIHSRNFTPGRDIKDNIEEAIEGSNSAIVVMSQGFVDSVWCKEEFTHCYIENMKDAAFNLFVIMMQPADTLVNISNYMKTFFANKTYLQKDDPDLFTKLAKHLEDARDTEGKDADNDINKNP